MFRLLLIALFTFASTITIAQQLTQDIDAFLDQNKNTLGLREQDLKEYKITNSYPTSHLRITHVYVEQHHLDIRVFNGILNLNLMGDRLVSFGNRWIPGINDIAPSNIPQITASSAVIRAAAHLDHNFLNPVEISKEQNIFGQDIRFLFAPGNLSREDIEAELLWLKGDQKDVLLCWKVQIHETENENIWDIFIDAHSGAFIRKDNLVLHCSFDTPSYDIVNFDTKDQFQFLNEENFLPPAPDSSYNVFALPVESPIHGDRSVQVRPWTFAGAGNHAVTLGWHNNGTTNFTSTRGNNVHAYEDMDNNNLPGFSPDTFNLRFDYPYVPSIDATDNLRACITNLFYWNNIIHDVMYQYGFNEVAGNFQNNNLGRGGLGNDYVKAEAQDGGGTNNANFSTPVDGSSGRMQMYLWDPVPETSPLIINSPPSIAGPMFAVESAFSTNNKLANIGLTTGNLILVNDVGGTHQACTTITNSLVGKIAVIDRGNCDFTVKVKNAQNLGAIAAIVVNNVPGAPIAMGGTDNTIVIPAVMISLSDGNDLKAVMNTTTVNASLEDPPLITPDGDFDNGIITHEYGHGISTRLTGGPANSSCLNNEEQMGEGWSDFFALMLTTDWTTAAATDPRGIGNYVTGGGLEGTGIRTYPYTIDTSQNPFTYADVATAPLINGNPSVHYIGSIWATMLWDMTWNIIAMEGVDADMYDGDGGNNIALQLVIDGCKLQPCNPGFVDGRDAILLADELNYGGVHRCAIWKAFAGRGLGVDADQGSSDDYNDGVVSFAIPDGVRIESTTNIYPAGEGQEVTFNLKTTCECVGKNDLDISDVLSNDLIYIPGSGGTLNANTIHFSTDTLAPMDSVEHTYHAYVKPCTATTTTTLSQDNAETPDKYVSIKLLGNGTRVWEKNTTQFVSPTRSWYAKDYTSVSDFVLKLINPVVTTSGPVEIGFYHRYNTEASYDGGVVEYSINGGTTWIDAGPYFTERGYPSSISAATNSTIAGRPAFTGNSDTQFGASGFVHSTIQLVLGGPQSLLIRFRMACDGSVGGSGINGWYVDDIFIKQLSGLTNQTRVVDNGQLVDSLYYALQTSVYSSNKIYVDPSAMGNRSGSSWANAMHYLPLAIEIAGCRTTDSVLVAQGTYLPSLTNNRTHSFNPGNNVYVYGGFPPGGSTFEMRNPATNITLLSGDIGISNNTTDNSYHVVKIDSAKQNILFDGIKISYGNANGTGDNSQGAAVFCLGGLTLNNVIINNNTGTANGQLIRTRSAAAQMILKDCSLYGTDDGFSKMLNTNSGRVTVQGTTMILLE